MVSSENPEKEFSLVRVAPDHGWNGVQDGRDGRRRGKNGGVAFLSARKTASEAEVTLNNLGPSKGHVGPSDLLSAPAKLETLDHEIAS